MRDCYIPDLTERYPEGFNGIDMYEPYDIEAYAWAEMDKEYREEMQRITSIGYKIIKQEDTWSLIRCNDDYLVLCIIENNEITSLYDSCRYTEENYKRMLKYYEDFLNE